MKYKDCSHTVSLFCVDVTIKHLHIPLHMQLKQNNIFSSALRLTTDNVLIIISAS